MCVAAWPPLHIGDVEQGRGHRGSIAENAPHGLTFVPVEALQAHLATVPVEHVVVAVETSCGRLWHSRWNHIIQHGVEQARVLRV